MIFYISVKRDRKKMEIWRKTNGASSKPSVCYKCAEDWRSFSRRTEIRDVPNEIDFDREWNGDAGLEGK